MREPKIFGSFILSLKKMTTYNKTVDIFHKRGIMKIEIKKMIKQVSKIGVSFVIIQRDIRLQKRKVYV